MVFITISKKLGNSRNFEKMVPVFLEIQDPEKLDVKKYESNSDVI